MSTIVISEFMDQDAVDSLSADFDTFYDPDLVDRPDELNTRMAGCAALIVRNRTQVRGDLLQAGRELKAIGRLGVGLDNIDVEQCSQRGIAVLPATGANNLCVAEYVIAGLFILVRGAYHSTAEVLDGSWPRNALIGGEISGKILGLVGFGGIARDVASRAHALGMQVIASDPYVNADDPAWQQHNVSNVAFDELLSRADAISLHVPLTEQTRHQFDAVAIASMKANAVLINAARGAVVDEPALSMALKSGHLGGAMLDVFEHEPLQKDSVLADTPNLLLTPHIAGVTVESNVRVSALTADNVRKALAQR